MKLIYHHRTQARGAEGVHIFGVVRAFRELGHEVEIVCPPRVRPEAPGSQAPPSTTPTTARLRSSRAWAWVSKAAPEWLFESFEVLYNLYSYLVLLVTCRRTQPDLIYDRYSLFNLGPTLVARQMGIALVTEVNDATVIERSRELRFKHLARFIEGFVFNHSTLVVTISGKFRSLIAEAHDIPESKIVVTPNAIDPARFLASGRGDLRGDLDLHGKCVIGVVGGFVPWHGLDFLVESLASHLLRWDDVSVLLVGDGPVRLDIETLVEARGLSGRVRFTGFVPAQKVPDFIAAMDICLMPDSNVHGSPIKIFEYMAMGKPVVAPRYEPIEEIIEDGANGVLFHPRDHTDLSRVVDRLIHNLDCRVHIGLEGRRRVLAKHTWRFNVETVLFRLDEEHQGEQL